MASDPEAEARQLKRIQRNHLYYYEDPLTMNPVDDVAWLLDYTARLEARLRESVAVKDLAVAKLAARGEPA